MEQSVAGEGKVLMFHHYDDRSLVISNSNITNTNGTQYIICNNYGPLENKCEEKCPVPIPYTYGLPDPVVNFCGREEEMEQIHERLANGSIAVLSQVVTISGLGGIGKTELAKSYAHKYGKDYDFIAYIIADTEFGLENAYFEIAEKFQIDFEHKFKDEDGLPKRKEKEKIVQELYHICSRWGKTLLILDNVENQQDILPYLPRQSLGDNIPKLIITSRRQNWDFGDRGHTDVIKVEGFPLETAIKYVEDNLNKEFYTEDDIKELWVVVDGLTIAIKLSLDSIKAKNSKYNGDVYTMKRFNVDLKKSKEGLIKFHDSKTTIYPFSIMAALKISIENIKQSQGNLAVKILECISYLPADNISIELFFNESRHTPAMKLLEDYSLINLTAKTISIHRLIQAVIRTDVAQQKREEIVVEEVIKLLNKCEVSDLLYPYVCTVWEVAIKYETAIRKYYKHVKYSPLRAYLTHNDSCDSKILEKMLKYELQYKGRKNVLNNILLSIAHIKLSTFEFMCTFLKFTHSNLKDILFDVLDRGNLDISKFVVEKMLDFDVNAKFEGWTKTILLVSNIAKILIGKERWDVNAKTEDGWSALMFASFRGFNEIVESLIRLQHCNINSRDNWGWTVLMSACGKGHVNVVKTLISDERCDVNAKKEDGWSALMIASLYGFEEIVRLLVGLQHCNINTRDNVGWTPLMSACAKGHVNVVKALIGDERCDVNAKKEDGITALMLAVLHGFEEIVGLLVGLQHCNINSRENQGWTALLCACQNGNVNIVKTLMGDERCDVSAKTERKATTLMIASFNGCEELVRLLVNLEHCIVDSRDLNGCTALVHACIVDRTNIVKILIDEKCNDINAKTVNGFTSLMFACRRSNEEIVKMLISDEHCDVNAQNIFGQTALMMACRKQSFEIVKALLECGRCDPNVLDEYEANALHYVCELDKKDVNSEIVRLLLDNDCDRFAKNNFDKTSLEYREQYNDEVNIALLNE